MTKTSSSFRLLGLAATMSILLGAGVAIAQSSGDSLEQGFQNPPNGARPRVWWHWMNGNITQEGINLDLEWMKRVGLGGFQNFDAALNTPQVVKTRLVYMTPEWKDAFLFATKKADQLGLEEAIAGSPGWSESGGPWVPPSQAMKKIVWSETQVEGGSPFTGTLPKPPTTTGPFQSLPFADFRSANSTNGLPPAPPKEFYADSAVVAYREPAAYVSTGELNPKTTSSGGQIDPAVLAGHDLKQTTSLPVAAPGKQAWIQFEFAKPEAIDAVTMVVIGGNARRGIVPPSPVLQQSSDGTDFKEVASIPTDGAVQHTVAFPQVAARYFRVAFTTPEANAAGSAPPPGAPPVSAPTEYKIAKLVLHSSARVNRFEEKAGFAPLADLYPFATPPVAAADAISKSTVLDLTSKMRPDGTLDWTPPPGHWVVLRMGYSLLGITNHPASPEATGLEVDKLNADYVKAYFNRYLDNYKDTVGPLMGKRGLQYVITDSWEAGTQNWTDNMIAEFTRGRGYSER